MTRDQSVRITLSGLLALLVAIGAALTAATRDVRGIFDGVFLVIIVVFACVGIVVALTSHAIQSAGCSWALRACSRRTASRTSTWCSTIASIAGRFPGGMSP